MPFVSNSPLNALIARPAKHLRFPPVRSGGLFFWPLKSLLLTFQIARSLLRSALFLKAASLS
jgi:hypothetical protein